MVHLTGLGLLDGVLAHRPLAGQTGGKVEHVFARAVVRGHVHRHAKRMDRIVGVVVAGEDDFRAPLPQVVINFFDKFPVLVGIMRHAAARGKCGATIAAAVGQLDVTVGGDAGRCPHAAHAQPGGVGGAVGLTADPLRVAAGRGHVCGHQGATNVQAKVGPAVPARDLKSWR